MKQKDYIEELIGKNLEALNDNEPSPGHFKRFEDKLKPADDKKIKIRFLLIGKIAAAAVFILLVVNQAIIWFSPGTEDNSSLSVKERMDLASVSPYYK